MSELARVEMHHEDARCIVRLRGEVDISNAQEVSAAIERALPNDAPTLVVDLTGTTYLDSAGIQLLFLLAGRLRSRRQEMRLVVPDDSPIRTSLELTGVPQVIPVDASVHMSGERGQGV